MISSKFVLILLACLFATSKGSDIISEVIVATSNCNQCGMTPLGTISIKICGASDCCYTPWMVGNFNEGSVDIFQGPSSLGECDRFLLREDGANFTAEMTIFHQGTDAGSFDSVEVFTTAGYGFYCDFSGLGYVDDNQYITSNDCFES